MRLRLAVMVGCAVLALGTQAAEPVRVALVHGSYGNFRHRDDYDGVMKQLGWKLDKFENQDFGKLAAQLAQYDIVLGTALFNYQQNVQDFSVYREPLMAFMQRGGAVVLTDANYPDHVNWLAKWGPSSAVSTEPCATTTTPNKWLDATHPIFSGAAPVRELPASWSHLNPGDGWQVIAKCADDRPTGIFRTEGRGFMMLSGFWNYGAPQLRNVWATLQYTRAGVLPQLPDLTQVRYGDNAVECRFRNLSDKPLTLQMKLEGSGPQGATPMLGAEGAAAPGEIGTAKLNARLSRRGAYELRLALRVKEGPEFPTATHRLVIPQLIETQIVEPRYRGAIMLAAPPKRIRAEVALHPLEEKLEGMTYLARLWRGEKLLSATPPRPLTGENFSVSLPFANSGSGDCSLQIALLSGKQEKYSARTTIPVIAPRANQVFIDEKLNLRVDGKPFFPICLYHVPVKDFPQVKALGFNSLQAWGTNPTQARENLDAGQANGLKVILEGTTYAAADGNLAALDPLLKAFENHPALLSWYLTDEPSGTEKLEWCRRVNAYLAQQDPHHPVFMTSCSPGEFARYAPVTDIFAVDPYPIPSQPVTMVSGWMKAAQEAVQGRKPVWLIPQLHNWAAYDGHPENGRYPTPEEERNMVYQGLVWGAKAIFYYPWDDGCTGLVKDEKLRAAVGKINGELAQLGPELLTRQYALTTPGEGGLYAATYKGDKDAYVIAVSVDKDAKEFTVPAKGLQGKAEVLFEGREVSVEAEAIKDRFEGLGVHVYRVR